jgi:hypothetical protein
MCLPPEPNILSVHKFPLVRVVFDKIRITMPPVIHFGVESSN